MVLPPQLDNNNKIMWYARDKKIGHTKLDITVKATTKQNLEHNSILSLQGLFYSEISRTFLNVQRLH